MEAIFQMLLGELEQFTREAEQNCRDVARRLTREVTRLCNGSDRIQTSREVEIWATTLARHRLNLCLQYYQLGSRQGRLKLHNTLSYMISPHITSFSGQLSEQAHLALIQEFLQEFYLEALNTFRSEAQLDPRYTPQTLLDLAEYMAFTERYAKRRIRASGDRSQPLIVRRAQAFSQNQP